LQEIHNSAEVVVRLERNGHGSFAGDVFLDVDFGLQFLGKSRLEGSDIVGEGDLDLGFG
jgi:hypothetical protein